MYRKSLKTPKEHIKLESKPCRSILKRTESPHTHSLKAENVLKAQVSGGVKSVKFKRSKSVQQARLRSKLNDWLETKGKTPSRYFNLMYFDEQLSAKKKRDRSLPGKLSEDLLGKQVQSLKKEEDLNARKKLFKDDSSCTTSKPTRKSTPLVRRRSSDKQKSVLKNENTPARFSAGRRSSTQDGDTKPFSDKSNKSSTPNRPLSEHRATEASSNEHVDNSSHHHPTVKDMSQEPHITDDDIRENLLSMLQECLTLFRAGCPSEHILSWLENMEHHIPQTQTCAMFYACKAELFTSDPIKMLEVFCQGVENKAEPGQVISKAMRQLLAPHLSCPEISPLTKSPPHSTTQTESDLDVYSHGQEAMEDDYDDGLSEDMMLTTQSCSSAEKSQKIISTDCFGSSLSTNPVKTDPHTHTSCKDPALSFNDGVNASGKRRSVKHTPVKEMQHQVPEGTPKLGSTVKYTVAAVTPIPGQLPSSVPKAVVTPVRRSTRLSNRHPTPQAQREIDSILDLTLKEAETTMYFANSAIDNC